MSESDQALMKLIHDQYGATIEQVCRNSSVKPAFLAALVANESGGNASATRFEKNVLAQLWEVVLDRKPAFGSITRKALVSFLDAMAAGADWTRALITIDQLATSWGLTQIMGYHVFDVFGSSVGKLQSAEGNLTAAVVLVTQFATRYSLDYDTDAADLFRCWNTGRPDGQTFDPNYAQNGLARLSLYEQIA